MNATPSWQRSLLVWGSLVLVVAMLYWARAVLIPVVLAVLLTFILSPAVTALQRRGLWRVPAVIVVVLIASVVVAGIGAAVVLQVKALATDLPHHKELIIEKIVSLQEASKGSWLENLTATFKDIKKQAAPGGDEAPVPVTVESNDYWSIFQNTISPVLELLVSAALVAVLVIFMLIQREDLRNRLLRLWGSVNLSSSTRALDDASRRISRFLFMQLLVNGGYGLAFGIGLFFIGVPYAFLWGFLAALLRYIPYLGVWVATAFPLVLSIAVLPGWTYPLLVLGLVLLLELITANVVEPMLFGQSIGVSEVALLISAAFWAWLWGPIGLVLATPMTACLAVLGRYVPQLEFFSIVLGDEPVLETYVSYYQRLLARDEDEAAELVEKYLQDQPAQELFDRVLVPALVLAERNRESDELSQADHDFLLQATRDLLEDLTPAALPDPDAAVNKIAGEPAGPPIMLLGCPAHDEADELALQMFRRLLDPARLQMEVLSVKTLSAEVVAHVRQKKPAAVLVAALPPEGVAQTRYLCKRLRTHFPELKILVGRWGETENQERVRERLSSAGADHVAFRLLESRDQLLALSPVLDHVQKAQPAADSA